MTTGNEQHMLMATSVTDWNVNIENPEETVVFYGASPKLAYGPQPVPSILSPWLDKLVSEIESSSKKAKTPDDGFIVKVHPLKYRCQWQDGPWYFLRSLPLKLWPIEKLYLSQDITDGLVGGGISSGLILVAGQTGCGKTTTVGSAIGERLSTLGGYCLTMEDPPEQPLEGWHGTEKIGFARQIQVHAGEFKKAYASALRCFPSGTSSIFYCGEVRTPESAAELLRIALDGHLVYSTIHAADYTSALLRLMSLAREVVGEHEARTLLAAGVELVVHQRRERQNKPTAEMLKSNDTVRGIIRQNKNLEGIQDEGDRQESERRKNRFAQKGKVSRFTSR